MTDIEQQKEFMNLCLGKISNANMTKIFLKIQREHLNCIVVNAVIDNLSVEKQKFLEYKYKKKWSLIKLEFELNVSKAQLCVWHSEILEQIENMLFYKLDDKDYFNIKKIISMILILDQQITYLESSCERIVNRESLRYLINMQTKYRKLYKIINDSIQTGDKYKTKTKILQARIELGAVSTMLLAKEVGCSIACVSTVLKNYKQTLKEVINLN